MDRLSAAAACLAALVVLAPAGAGAAREGPPCPADVARAEAVLFPEGASEDVDCADEADEVRCLIAARYAADAAAAELALALYDEHGDLAGVEVAFEMDGGFRGTIEIVPEPPVGGHRTQLRRVLAAQREIAAFLEQLEAHADAPLAYDHAPLDWHFFRSVGRTTPSAYARDWAVAFNVDGSLNRSPTSVRELVFHELFHLNDEAHGDWSRRTLGPDVDAIVERCGTDIECLTPFAPGRTRVRGGTYYAFQPDNGVIAREYAAELAVRYFLEHRAVLASEPLAEPPFRCGPEENARAWRALADEFFGGVDLVPACP